MTMHSNDAALIEEDHSENQSDDWSTAPVTPEPTAPSESDLMMYNAMDDNNIEVHHSSNLMHSVNQEDSHNSPTVEQMELPPTLPVGVMETIQPPSSSALYDYQRDHVLYSAASHVVPHEDDGPEAEYRMALVRQEYQPTTTNMLVGKNDFQISHEMMESTAVASGIAGAVVGTLVLGTFPGLVAGFYTAYAHGQRGAAGDIARALGEIAMITREKSLVIDRKHNLVARGKIALAEAWGLAKELDRQHSIMQRLAEFSMFAWTMALQFVRRSSLPPAPGISTQHQRYVCQQNSNRQRVTAPSSSEQQYDQLRYNAYSPGVEVPMDSSFSGVHARYY